MGQIKDLTLTKTTLADADLCVLDDPADANKSKKFSLLNLYNYITGKLTATPAEINSVCAGNTATASEIAQICDGREAGGSGAGDIVINDAAQELKQKILTAPYLNDPITTITITGAQANTLANTTGSGRVNEVQQGLNVGNATIVASGTFSYHGLINLNFSTSGSLAQGAVSGYNASEFITFRNISASATVTVNRSGSDRFWNAGTGYTSMAIASGGAVTLQAIGSGYWIIVGYANTTLS